MVVNKALETAEEIKINDIIMGQLLKASVLNVFSESDDGTAMYWLNIMNNVIYALREPLYFRAEMYRFLKENSECDNLDKWFEECVLTDDDLFSRSYELKYAKKDLKGLNPELIKMFFFKSYVEYYSFLLINFALIKKKVRICQCCGKFFIPKTKRKHTVTVGNDSYRLEEPFLVLATQNPIENEGTYPLPEAQLDRFMFKILVNFPSKEELKGIVDLTEGLQMPPIQPLLDGKGLVTARSIVAQIPIADAVMDYILNIVMATHAENKYIREGASPRAAQALIRASRAKAFMEGRMNVSFEDVKYAVYPVLRHRIILGFDAVSEGVSEDQIITEILNSQK